MSRCASPPSSVAPRSMEARDFKGKLGGASVAAGATTAKRGGESVTAH